MPGLSDIFNNGDSDNSSSSGDNMTHTAGDATNDLGLNVDSSQSNANQDEDGNSSQQNNDNSIGLDSSTDGLLHSVTDSMSQSDESDS